MISTRRRALLVALALLVPVAACGGSDDGGGDVATLGGDAEDGNDSSDGGGGEGGGPRDNTEFQDAALEYAQCMRDHGVDMDDPDFSGEGGVVQLGAGAERGADGEPSEDWTAADDECHPIIEEAAPEMNLDPEEQAEMQDRMVAVAECMRERGYDMPDPEVDSEGRVQMRGGPPPEGAYLDEEFQADMEECSDEAGMEGGPGRVQAQAGGD